MTQTYPIRLVQMIGGEFIVTNFTDPKVDLIAAMAVRGYEFTGLNQNRHHRAELQGQPKFAQLCGPMWDGDAIRYEDSRANDALSV